MTWKLSWTERGRRSFEKLDPQIRKRLLKFLVEKITPLEDPRTQGEPLTGDEYRAYWRYRVGDYRIVTRILDRELEIAVVKAAHRSEVYRRL